MDRRTVERLLTWLSGALVLSGLWMFDEILTEVMYCAHNCLYPIPLIGSFTPYAAEGIAWIMVLSGMILFGISTLVERL